MPTASFNVVYQFVLIYNHLFQEGIGLRQIVDYYLVVMSDELLVINDSLQRELKHLGLWKFAGAVMYVLHEALGLPEEKMIVPMDSKRGRFLLEEILASGNFGKHVERYGFGHSAVGHNMQRLFRDLRLVRYYPTEALSEPMFRVWHFLWRMWQSDARSCYVAFCVKIRKESWRYAIFRPNGHHYVYGVIDKLGYVVVVPEYSKVKFLDAHTVRVWGTKGGGKNIILS